MANYSFVISHAVGLEETSEKPDEPQQCKRKQGEKCKPCESKMRIRNSVDQRENFPENHAWASESNIWANFERHRRRE